jgi:hypothetical protein
MHLKKECNEFSKEDNIRSKLKKQFTLKIAFKYGKLNFMKFVV